MQTSKIISRPSDGVTRKRRAVWNGNWFYWKFTILNYNLLWRIREFKQRTVRNEKHWVFPVSVPSPVLRYGLQTADVPFLDSRTVPAQQPQQLLCSYATKLALYCRYTVSGLFSRKHHCLEHALPWKSDPLPRNGSPWRTHDCGTRPLCHNIYF
jgi:hypothetical protein